jgi:hypothetical protein
MTDRAEAPSPDEFEVSVFGRGFGEAICIHLGAGQWVLIDSCLNPRTGEPASLDYLRDIGVSVDAVCLVLITHWDNDHIRGITKIVKECSHAKVACSQALDDKDAFQFVIEQEQEATPAGPGLDELRSVLRLCRDRGIVWAKGNLPLHPRPPGDRPNVVALSPSEDAVERGILSLIEAATGKQRAVTRRYRVPEGPNGASVATSIRSGEVTVLMGADLEASSNPETGWAAVLAYARPSARASLVKVPHHGSPDAHHDGMWSELLNDDRLAILTPFSNGDVQRPTEEDVARILGLAAPVYLSAIPTLKKVELHHRVERLVRRLHAGKVVELQGWGHLRARRPLDGSRTWDAATEGDAVRVE